VFALLKPELSLTKVDNVVDDVKGS
jgi:hypothetical protein